MFLTNEKSVAGSTIVEVVTGVFLIALAMALSIMVFSKTMDNSNLYVKHQAVNMVNNELHEFWTNSTNGISASQDEISDGGDLRITATKDPFPGHDSLEVIVYSARLKSTGKEIYKRRLIKKIVQ
jgi:hypothetical protein